MYTYIDLLAYLIDDTNTKSQGNQDLVCFAHLYTCFALSAHLIQNHIQNSLQVSLPFISQSSISYTAACKSRVI